MSLEIVRGRLIVLGVSGSIAAYKAVELARHLTQAGAAVPVVVTRAALKRSASPPATKILPPRVERKLILCA